MYGGILMRKYMYTRYMPYIRAGYRNRPRMNAVKVSFFRDFALFFRIIVFAVCLAAAAGSLSRNFQAAAENICEYKAAQLVNECIDYGVLEAAALYQGKGFVTVGYDSYGTVTSVETDTIEINRFASLLSESIHARIRSLEHEVIKIPLCTVTDSKILSFFGISIPFRIVSAGMASVSPYSAFYDAGINQTVHKLSMSVSVKIKILFPLINREEEIEREIIISETVIVGDVPEMLITREN